MSAPEISPAVPAAPVPRVHRLFGRWWRRQSPTSQDRFATIGPLISVLLFLAAIIAAFWTLRNEEIAREADAVQRDTEIAQQQIRLYLSDDLEQLMRLARDIGDGAIGPKGFAAAAAELALERPSIAHITWISAERHARASHASTLFHPEVNPSGGEIVPELPQAGVTSESERTFNNLRSLRGPVFSGAFRNASGAPAFQLQVPLFDQGRFAGAIVTEYAVEPLLRQMVPPEVTQRHTVAVIDADGKELAGSVLQMPGRAGNRPTIVVDLPLAPAANGLFLRGMGWRTSVGLVGNALFWMVVSLSALTLWMLWGTWRHVRRRSQIQNALVQETNFRRAMENSMLTGMRALDNDGRITYVNPAFCAMTGFADDELVGHLPPFPYWPPDRVEENSRLLQQEMQGRSPAGGIEVKVMRKDGGEFDARMYVSPLVDSRGQQTGWMTSMTNITEAKRIRDQLSASHERFTTVLEGLDAAVSVMSVQQGELLFANRSYRLWFGADPKGHALLAGQAAALPFVAAAAADPLAALPATPAEALGAGGADPREVYVEAQKKWFDVRSRYLQWTDGRLAQMLIATDITQRRRIEEQAARQAERAEVTSRLMTMGEMASSVAHELNQPLAAIVNYCSGMVSRVRGGNIAQDDLIEALSKTSRQAERAAQIISRVRGFVKRSEPQRQMASVRALVDEALELAGIELRRRNVALSSYVAQRLPPLACDPILIQQVLMNLLKNAAEAIDSAQLPPQRRQIELRVVPRHTPEEGGVIEFSVTDHGPGVREDVLARLYEAFFSTKAEGLGIGLALCRSIIESHRGRMKAQNLYNLDTVVGCRFTFTLPVDPSTIRSESAGPSNPAAAAPLTTDSTP